MSEFARYLAVRDRALPLPPERLRDRVRGRSVLVTGSSGCVGTALMRELAALAPARLAGIGLEAPAETCGAEYRDADVRDAAALRAQFDRVRPDVVFHLAAQRDPGLAETAVATTVATNVIGTVNVVEQCAEFGVADLVYASTGKAMRPYTRDVYAASKKIAEWLVTSAAASGTTNVTIARFTHVVDNAIVLRKFRDWCRSGEPLRLHDPEALFYAQSALEAAQLLLGCLLTGRSGQPVLCAITDLGWPFRLEDIADGVLAEFGRTAAVDVVGEQPGYEQGAYPGLYDPEFSGGISPLINAIEGRSLLDAGLPGADVVAVRSSQSKVDGLVAEMGSACAAGATAEDEIRDLLDRASRELLDVIIGSASDDLIARIGKLMRHCDSTALSPTHQVIGESIRARAATRGEDTR